MARAKGKKPPRWTPFQRCNSTIVNGVAMPLPEGLEIYRNSLYQVHVTNAGQTAEGWRKWQLSIRRNDRAAIHDWRDLQRIKNELIDPEAEGVEMYPAESRLHDTCNQYHLWVVEGKGARIPIGFAGRVVIEHPAGGARQRPFEPDARPADVREDDGTVPSTVDCQFEV